MSPNTLIYRADKCSLNQQVMFRKVMGDPPVAQVAFTFSMLGFINASLCWPICLGLYLTGAEVMPWESLSWIVLFIACVLMLGKLKSHSSKTKENFSKFDYES